MKNGFRRIWDTICAIGLGIGIAIASLLILAVLAVIGVVVYIFGGVIVMGLLGAGVILAIIVAFAELFN